MNVRNLSTTSYPQTRRAIDDMTIEMYMEITSSLLHDESPLRVATEIKDIWEVVADTLYDNTNLTHRQFAKCMCRILKLLDECFKSLGVDDIDWDFQ
jgi:hypothetical protein